MNTASKTKQKTTKPQKEYFIADALMYIPGQTGRQAWGREVLRARTPRALLRLLDGRPHIAYATNGVQAVRIALIDTGTVIFAPVWPHANTESLQAVLNRIDADPHGWSA